VRRVVGNLLLLLWRWWSLDLLDVRRLMGRRALGIGVVRRRVVRLGRTLCRCRLVGRVGVLLVLVLVLLMLRMVAVVDYSRPGMVCRMVVWRRQALGRVGVMLRDAQCQRRCRLHGV
jgi:hypothetical protein